LRRKRNGLGRGINRSVAFAAARSSDLDVNVVDKKKKVWAVEQQGFNETKEQFGR
jgi:hypothetical protein